MKIALTGASGFIGYKLTHLLLEAGHDLKLLYYKRPPLTHGRIEVVKAGLNDEKALADLVDGVDAVVHCAGLVAAVSKADFYKVNVTGTKNIAEAAKRAGVKKFLLLSSMAARAPDLSPYADSKAMAEEVLKSIPDLPWDVLRPPGVYGPGDLQVLSLFQILKKGIALLPAGRDAKLSVIHVDDLASAISAWIEHKTPSQSIYEIAGPQGDDMGWVQMHEIVASELGVKPKFLQPHKAVLKLIGAVSDMAGKLSQKPQFLGTGKVNELCHTDWLCHDRRFEDEAKWVPAIHFKDGVKQTLQWYKEKNYL